MKKLIFFVMLSSFITSIVFAQNTIFTFVPKDESNVIDSINAINLATGESFFVKGTNEISFTSTSVNTPMTPESIKFYPNPSIGKTEMQFYSKQNNVYKINIINTAGQIVASQKHQLKQGFHKFKITTKFNGMYLIQVIGDKNKFSKKIITAGNNHNINEIQYIGLASTITQEKSAAIDKPDVLHFLIYSGDKITKIADSLVESKTYEVEFYECKDGDGNNYPIVQIGEQWWMAKNLAYLPSVSSPNEESTSTTESNYFVSDYNGTDVAAAKAISNYSTYGVLYNWPAAIDACPSGWHLPTDEEWKQLEMAIGMSKSEADTTNLRGTNEGTKLKATSGWVDNGTDDFGFSGLPGNRRNFDGTFDSIGYGIWWSSTENDTSSAWIRSLTYFTTKVNRSYYWKVYGFSVRCIRD